MVFNCSCYFYNILSVHMTELRNITDLHVQCNDHLASLVVHMEKKNKLSQPARDIIRKLYSLKLIQKMALNYRGIHH